MIFFTLSVQLKCHLQETADEEQVAFLIGSHMPNKGVTVGVVAMETWQWLQ